MTDSADVNAADLDALRTLAAQLGLTDSDLDDTVYELTNSGAAERYNDGALPDLDDDDAYNELHDTADAEASDINNGGLHSQLAYLLRCMNLTAACEHLRTLTGTARDTVG